MDGLIDDFQEHLTDGASFVDQMNGLDMYFDKDDHDTMQLLEVAYFGEKSRIAQRDDIQALARSRMEKQMRAQNAARMFSGKYTFSSGIGKRLNKAELDGIASEMKAGMEWVVAEEGLEEKHHSEGLDEFEDSSGFEHE